MARLYEYVIPVRSATRDAFIASQPHPFLLLRRDLDEARSGWTFQTETLSVASGNPRHMGAEMGYTVSPELANWEVFPVAKGGDNPWSERVSVGRARNNDIVLLDSSVSKLHAHFRREKGAAVVVVDVGSRNGTRVNGRRLETGETAPVEPGDTVTFGKTSMTFVDAASLYDLVRRNIQARG